MGWATDIHRPCPITQQVLGLGSRNKRAGDLSPGTTALPGYEVLIYKRALVIKLTQICEKLTDAFNTSRPLPNMLFGFLNHITQTVRKLQKKRLTPAGLRTHRSLCLFMGLSIWSFVKGVCYVWFPVLDSEQTPANPSWVELNVCRERALFQKQTMRRKGNSNESVNSLVSVMLGCTDQNYHMALGEGTSEPRVSLNMKHSF